MELKVVKGYTDEQIEFIKEKMNEMTFTQMSQEFAERWGVLKKPQTLRAYASKRKFPRTKLPKQTSHLKGKTYEEVYGKEKAEELKRRLAESTAKNGPRIREVGVPYEIPSVPGYRIKLENGDIIDYEEYVYTQVHGPIPQDMKVVHIDGDPYNNDIDNLKLEKKTGSFINREVGVPYRIPGSPHLRVKTEDGKYMRYSRYLYIQEHGPIDSDTVVIQRDGDPDNLDIDNLFAVSRAATTRVAKDPVLREVDDKATAWLVAEIEQQLYELQRDMEE